MKIVNSKDYSAYRYCDVCGDAGKWFLVLESDDRVQVCRPCFEKAAKLWQEHDKELSEKE